MPAAVFIVRSTVADPAKRTTFWSLTDPAIHQAVYSFDDEAALDRAMKEEVPR